MVDVNLDFKDSYPSEFQPLLGKFFGLLSDWEMVDWRADFCFSSKYFRSKQSLISSPSQTSIVTPAIHTWGLGNNNFELGWALENSPIFAKIQENDFEFISTNYFGFRPSPVKWMLICSIWNVLYKCETEIFGKNFQSKGLKSKWTCRQR